MNSSGDTSGAATAYAYALLRNYAGAEDAAQAAFLSAWLHRDDLREPQAFGGWLRTIVRTECSADRAANTPGDRSD